MKPLTIVVEGLSEEQVRRDIEKNLKGWTLLFDSPKEVDYEFFNPFFGHHWNGTADNLKDIFLKYCVNKETNKIRPHICRFMWNGEDRFYWCSWTKELYACNTQIKYSVEPKFIANITILINQLFNN